MEAALAGLPIVATDLPGCNDVIRDGWSGWLVPPRSPRMLAERILRMLREPAAAREMGRRAAEHVRRDFSLELVVQRYRDLYLDLLAGRRTSPATQKIRPSKGSCGHVRNSRRLAKSVQASAGVARRGRRHDERAPPPRTRRRGPVGRPSRGHRARAPAPGDRRSFGSRAPADDLGERDIVVTYNGEVYNFLALRRELEAAGCRFRGHSDTEVMLAAFERFGVGPALERFAGMFAIAAWDRRERVLHLVRDRMGKKPLYVGAIDGAVFFASELSALHAFPGFHPSVEPAAAAAMLQYGWIPDPLCIFKGVFKLPPASHLAISAADLEGADVGPLQAKVRQWWSLARSPRQARAKGPTKTTANSRRSWKRSSAPWCGSG